MEGNNGKKKCKNCTHDIEIIWDGKLWIHVITSIKDGKGSFEDKGKADIICPICGCKNPEPKL